MAQIDLGKLKFNWRGTWNNTTAYETDDVVYRNGQAYVAVADEAAGTAAPEENADWELMSAGINFRGEWNIATTYYLYDTVTEDGGLFILDGADENEGITGADPTLGGDWTAITPAPAQNVLTEIGDMVFRNNEGNNQRLTINPTIGKGLSVAEAPRETYSSRQFTYEENGTGGNTVLTAGSVPAVTYTIRTRNVRTNHFTLNGQDRDGTFSWIQEPTVTVNIGDTITFNNTDTFAAHPMAIRVSNGGASVTTGGYTGEGTATVSWDTTGVAAGTYFYQCTNHAGMVGQIVVRDITNRQGANNANGTIDVTRGKSYTITLDNVTNGVAYNLFSAAAPQIGAANAITLAEGNGSPNGTTFNGTAITFTFTPNETTPNTVFLASQANTANMVTITVNDNVYVPSWGAAAGAAAGDNRRFRHWQDWYGGDCCDQTSGTPSTFGQILPASTRDPGTDVTINGTAVGAQQRRLWRGDTGGATTDWTVPDGVERVRVTAIGGGGGSSSHTGSYYGGDGGGGGSWASGEYTVTPGQVLRIVAGHGGDGKWGTTGGTGGTTTVQDVNGATLGAEINLSAEGGDGGSWAGGAPHGGDDVTAGGASLVAGTAIRSAGGDGGSGTWGTWAWGPEGYTCGGGGAAGSMFGVGGHGGSASQYHLGGWHASCGGGGIAGNHGGNGGGNYTSDLQRGCGGGGGGGTAGPGKHGYATGSPASNGSDSAPMGNGGEGGAGLTYSAWASDYDDHMPFVNGQGVSHSQRSNSQVLSDITSPTTTDNHRANIHIANCGARFGDGEAENPANGWDPNVWDDYDGFTRMRSKRGMGAWPTAPTMNFGEDAWNGVLGRLWGGGGSGGGCGTNQWANSCRGGDGGSGAGGGGSMQWTYSDGMGNGHPESVCETHVWDTANMAWRMHDKFLNAEYRNRLITTSSHVYGQRHPAGGCGGALGGGGGGGMYGSQGGHGGIGGGGGGGSSSYSPQYYSQGGHGGVGYVMIEWA